MRKLMILSAAALAIFLAMPQLAEATTVSNATTLTQDKAVKYQEVTASTLPDAVSKAIAKDYAGFAIDKVFLGDDGTYKVAVSKGATKNVILFSKTGEFISAEAPTPEPAK